MDPADHAAKALVMADLLPVGGLTGLLRSTAAQIEPRQAALTI